MGNSLHLEKFGIFWKIHHIQGKSPNGGKLKVYDLFRRSSDRFESLTVIQTGKIGCFRTRSLMGAIEVIVKALYKWNLARSQQTPHWIGHLRSNLPRTSHRPAYQIELTDVEPVSAANFPPKDDESSFMVG